MHVVWRAIVNSKISIVVPVYKTEQYLRQCVASICEQTYANLEIILVDDGSPDNCGAICDKLATQDKRIKVIHKTNGGLSDARNAGLQAVTGDLVGFVDSDDTIEKIMYAEMLAYMEANQLDIVCCDAYIVRGKSKKVRARYEENKLFEGKFVLREILNGDLDNGVWNKVFKREMISDTKFPVGRVFEDIATTYKFFVKAKKLDI